jgi:hypothetical protein
LLHAGKAVFAAATATSKSALVEHVISDNNSPFIGEMTGIILLDEASTNLPPITF